MQQWEHAQLVFTEEGVKVFYFTPYGVNAENAVVDRKGDWRDWVRRKIAKLGQDGWEMVSANDNFYWQTGFRFSIWFKRPSL